MKFFRMGIDYRPDWFCDRLTENVITTYSDDLDCGPFSFKRTYCDIRSDSGEILRANYGDYVLWFGNEHFAVLTPENFEKEYIDDRIHRFEI